MDEIPTTLPAGPVDPPPPQAVAGDPSAPQCQVESPAIPPLPPPPPVDPRIEQVRAILHQQSRGGKLWRNLAGLLVSLAAFLIICGSQFSLNLAELLILTGVVFLHELGHSVGMLLAGYKNVRILFIPMLGAATIGTDVRPSAGKNVVMTLLGPVPGIILGAALALYYAQHFTVYNPHPLLANAIQMLMLVNLFNLIPINPLDGYRVLEGCLFARRPTADLVVKLVMAGLLAVIAAAIPSFWVGLFAAFFLLTVPMQYRWAKAAVGLANQIPPETPLRGDHVPEPYLTHILQILWTRPVMRKASAKTLAAMVKNVWQRVCVKAPSAAEAVVYLLLYLWCFGGGMALSLLCFIVVEHWQVQRPILRNLLPRPDDMSLNLLAGLIVYVLPMLALAIVAMFLRLFRTRKESAQ